MTFIEVVETVGTVIDGIGVAVIAIGTVVAASFSVARLLHKTGDTYRFFREQLGRSILLGLEFLVAADIIRTVAVTPTGQSVAVLAGIVGAFLVVPFAMLVRRVKTAPPGIVLMLAAFWALVPGALSFESLSEAATGGAADIATLGVTAAAIFSIALGTLIGWSVFHTINNRLEP